MEEEVPYVEPVAKPLSSIFGFILYTLAICSNQIAYTLMKLAHKEIEEANTKNDGPP